MTYTLTLRDILRNYADGLRDGRHDTDRSAKVRNIAAVVLATASNDPIADFLYMSVPTLSDDRGTLVRRTSDRLWNGNVRAFADALAPRSQADFEAGLTLGFDILRNI